MASSRKIILEILKYHRFIGGDSVSLASVQWAAGRTGLYSVPKLFGVCATGCIFLFQS
jgi:hypothetical protein